MKILECAQLSPEWFAARSGIPTASSFDKIITTKGEPSKEAKKYMYRLAGERVSGICEEGYVNAAMQRGIDLEPEAIAFYELVSGAKVDRVGFCYEEGMWGCSPDGLVGVDGMIQIKCPSMAVHVGYLLDNKLPTDYFQQVQGELFVTGRKWSDFISYFGGLKPVIVRVYRDEIFIAKLKQALEVFCNELDQTVQKISHL